MKAKIASKVLTFISIGAQGSSPFRRVGVYSGLVSMFAVYLALTRYSVSAIYCEELHPGKKVSRYRLRTSRGLRPRAHCEHEGRDLGLADPAGRAGCRL